MEYRMSLLDLVANNMEEPTNDNAQLLAVKIAELQERIAALTNKVAEPVEGLEVLPDLDPIKKEATVKVAKNHKPGKPSADRKYVLLDKVLKNWGKVPQQQADIAKILADNFEVGKEYAEAEVFDVLMDKFSEFTSLANSRQDPTYLFRYYRGLGDDGKHAGFVARDFMHVIG
jgi:cell division septum initiation protein DivIVA